MDPANVLTVYIVTHKADRDIIVQSRALQMRYHANGKNHIGLRQRPSEALERAQDFAKVAGQRVTATTHELCKISFTCTAFAYFAALPMGKVMNFAPCLHKMTYPRDPKDYDWQVWHFHADLPIHMDSDPSKLSAQCEWLTFEQVGLTVP